ncbi:response regulator transcription factor [Ruminococcus flavefaciens]|uniref:response regulator transcription factor n=1 Tax=Ruminococcus flavefaciens TaxID=1265 RepID=UPI0026F3621C|nr:response regulator [Ruminococcus flavefaciens]
MNRVLIIEDEMDTAQPVKDALALESIDADIACNGEKGIDLFTQNNYDLVLLDLKMPGMSGEDVLSQIRKEDPYVDVIVYTNYSEFADIKKLTNIGIDGYINKGPNANLDELIEAIKRKLAPLSEEQLQKLIEKTPESFFRGDEDE